MSVAVAHQTRSTSHAALREAAREAGFRDTELAVIHVAESLDQDLADAYHAGISDEIERALGAPGAGSLRWTLHLEPGGSDVVAHTILRIAKEVDAELLVIGGRRRSPVGKALMGSNTQKIILSAMVPVLVMMPDA